MYGIKFSAIEQLARVCQKVDVPLEAHVELTGGEEYRWRVGGLRLVTDSISARYGDMDKIDDATVARIEGYLQKGHPRSRIQELEDAAEDIRHFLLENFTLEELLWNCKHFKDDAGSNWLV